MFRPARAYGDLNFYDALKIIALAAMIADHVGEYLLPDALVLRAAGRMAFPLFLFLIGYSGKWKMTPGLLFWAAAITVVAGLTSHPIFPLNILVSIVVTRWMMEWLTRRELTPKRLALVFAAALVWLPLMLWYDYSTLALLFALAGYLHASAPEKPGTRWFLYAAFALYFALEFAVYRSHVFYMYSVTVFFASSLVLMRDLSLHPLPASYLPACVQRVLQWIARNTLPIYGLHLMLLMAIECWCFPERLAVFRWF